MNEAGYAERYLQGEYEQVWAELVALGAQVGEEPVYSQACEVARETMQRVRANITVLIPRLRAIGYRFGYGWAVERGRLNATDVSEFEREQPLFTNPPASVASLIEVLERRAGILPLSLRMFYEVVGGVNFVGSHALWENDRLDPLEILSAQSVLSLDDWMRWSEDRQEDGFCAIPISPDEHFKYLYSGGGPYTVSAGALVVDAPLRYEWHSTTFVNYLRICLHWGGMPGWERGNAPAASVLAMLREGLTPF